MDSSAKCFQAFQKRTSLLKGPWVFLPEAALPPLYLGTAHRKPPQAHGGEGQCAFTPCGLATLFTVSSPYSVQLQIKTTSFHRPSSHWGPPETMQVCELDTKSRGTWDGVRPLGTPPQYKAQIISFLN